MPKTYLCTFTKNVMLEPSEITLKGTELEVTEIQSELLIAEGVAICTLKPEPTIAATEITPSPAIVEPSTAKVEAIVEPSPATIATNSSNSAEASADDLTVPKFSYKRAGA